MAEEKKQGELYKQLHERQIVGLRSFIGCWEVSKLLDEAKVEYEAIDKEANEKVQTAAKYGDLDWYWIKDTQIEIDAKKAQWFKKWFGEADGQK
jgi:hypothetical protein